MSFLSNKENLSVPFPFLFIRTIEGKFFPSSPLSIPFLPLPSYHNCFSKQTVNWNNLHYLQSIFGFLGPGINKLNGDWFPIFSWSDLWITQNKMKVMLGMNEEKKLWQSLKGTDSYTYMKLW